MLYNSLDHCLRYAVQLLYGSGREPCTDKVFSPGLGVLSGFVFQHHSPGDTTLSELGDSYVVSLRLALYHYKLVYKLDVGVNRTRQ